MKRPLLKPVFGTLVRLIGCGSLMGMVGYASLTAQTAAPAPAVAIPLTGSVTIVPAAQTKGAATTTKDAPTKDAADKKGKEGTSTKPGEPAEAKEEPKPNPKLTKFKQLTFDRRPSNILKVWNEVNSPPRPPAEKTEAEKEAEKKAGAQTKDGKKEAKKDPLDDEMKLFRQDVILSKWDKVKAYIKTFPAEDTEAAYSHLLTGLNQGGMGMGMPAMASDSDNDAEAAQMRMMQMQMMQQRQQGIPQEFLERNTFTTEDILGIAAAAPGKIEEKQLKSLGSLLQNTLSSGRGVLENTLKRFQELAKLPENQSPLNRRQFAKLLTFAGQAQSSSLFLPTAQEAETAKDAEALNLLTQHYLAIHKEKQKAEDLEKAWKTIQAVLGIPDTKHELHDEAMRRAVELAPRIKEILGQAWLEESFTKKLDRGREILSTLGARTLQGIQTYPQQSATRLGELKLQKLAVEALIKAAPERAKEWKEPLTLLAAAWLKEAEFSRQFDRSASLGPRMSFDQFGNVFYTNDDDDAPMMRFQPQMPFQAIRVGDLLEAMPDENWIKTIEEGFYPKFIQGVAQIYLKVKEEAKSFPYIERLAATHPDKAKELVKEFLRVWTRNHNLNQERQTRNPFVFYYGFERRQEGVPLTRSKQERNLVELAEWVAKIRKLPVGDVDQELIAKAFTSSHSNAEVYRLEMIESVLGPMKTIKPRTLAGLVEQMRQNLAGIWRNPAVQEDKKTNRKQKDIQQEVMRGYQLALAVTDSALVTYPSEWSLTLAKAALLHDELNYQSEIAKSTEFAGKRDQAMVLFQKAANQYAEVALSLPEEDQTQQAYEQWFYASLGAVDARFIDEEKLVDGRQPALVKKSFDKLPGELAKKHRDRFANSLFTKMSGVKPAAKFRYLKAGFDIVGENKAAWEARKLYEYYKDLVTEIKLETVVDGSTKVGHDGSFGAFVNLRHTREIERESGGFSKYLQNQNSGIGYYYNYGRPTADYRDRFQDSVKEALKDQFEVISVTFQDEKVNSRSTAEYGWRITPYAYMLLKPRGPQVDRIPSIKMDMDFVDTSGYVVLPVATAPVPIDATSKTGDPRPRGKTVVTQILDERQAAQGKLILEVKATAVGLIGDLNELIDLKPTGFEVSQITPQPVSIVRFDPEAPQAINAERSWMVHFSSKPGTNPKEFSFGAPKDKTLEMVYQRYNDADLVNAEPLVNLEATYTRRDWKQIGLLSAGGAFLIGLLGVGVFQLSRRKVIEDTARLPIPEKLDVFNLLGLLERVQHEGKLSETQRKELDQTVRLLEKDYFSAEKLTGVETNLREIAEKWVKQI